MTVEELMKNAPWKTPYFQINDKYWDAGARGKLTFLKRELGGWLARHDVAKLLVQAQEEARKEERKKVAQEIFGWLDNQPYFQTGDGEYEDFVKELKELREKYLPQKEQEKKVI